MPSYDIDTVVRDFSVVRENLLGTDYDQNRMRFGSFCLIPRRRHERGLVSLVSIFRLVSDLSFDRLAAWTSGPAQPIHGQDEGGPEDS